MDTTLLKLIIFCNSRGLRKIQKGVFVNAPPCAFLDFWNLLSKWQQSLPICIMHEPSRLNSQQLFAVLKPRIFHQAIMICVAALVRNYYLQPIQNITTSLQQQFKMYMSIDSYRSCSQEKCLFSEFKHFVKINICKVN